MADPIKVPDVPRPVAELCWTPKVTPPHMLVRCDRKAGHTGRHSWDHADLDPPPEPK